MDPAEPQRMPDDEVDGIQAWVRCNGDPVRGVEALQLADSGRWNWQVGLWVAEYLREEPLEGEMRRGVDAAIRSVPGVTEVAEEDREVWILTGDPDGAALVAAVGAFIDTIAPRAQADLDRDPDDVNGGRSEA